MLAVLQLITCMPSSPGMCHIHRPRELHLQATFRGRLSGRMGYNTVHRCLLQALQGVYDRVLGISTTAGALPVTVGGDGCRPVPLARWDVDGYSRAAGSTHMETRFGAFVAGADAFDAAAFSLSRCATLFRDFVPQETSRAAAASVWNVVNVWFRRSPGGRCKMVLATKQRHTGFLLLCAYAWFWVQRPSSLWRLGCGRCDGHPLGHC